MSQRVLRLIPSFLVSICLIASLLAAPYVSQQYYALFLVLQLGLLAVTQHFTVSNTIEILKRKAPTLDGKVRSALEPLSEPAYDVILEDAGERHVAAARCLRQLFGFGLKEAVDMVSHTPSVINNLEGWTKGRVPVSKEEAEYVAARLADCGAKVSIVKQSTVDE